MTGVVVDTNVAIVANDASLPADCDLRRPIECVSACVTALRKITANGHLVLDSADLIFNEYKTHLNFSGQPGVGDLFMKWVHDHQWDPDVCTRVEITPHDDRAFAEFPDHTDLAGFDWDDRKFVAVACAHGPDVRILQAVDEKKWARVQSVLKHCGAPVRFLCAASDRA